jgi:hypothetical protein
MGAAGGKPEAQSRFDVQREADRIVLSQYAPAGLVVDQNLHILHFRGQCSPYLSPPPGQASLGLLRMVRPELAVELRTALHNEKKTGDRRSQGRHPGPARGPFLGRLPGGGSD